MTEQHLLKLTNGKSLHKCESRITRLSCINFINTWSYTVSFRLCIKNFLEVAAMKRKNFKQIFALIQYNVLTADDNNKVWYFTEVLVVNIFKLVLYFNCTISTTKSGITKRRLEGIFWRFSLAISLQIHYRLLLKEYSLGTYENYCLERSSLEHHGARSSKVCDCIKPFRKFCFY